MKEFNFTIFFKGKDFSGEMVFIDAKSETWTNPVQEEKFIGLLSNTVKHYLSTAFVSRGHLFNLGRHSPKQLYEALIGNPDYEIILDGDIPENRYTDEDLPPDAID